MAEAIHRALFLPARTAGAALNQLRTRPFEADPTISLQFSADGNTYQLRKTFAGSRGSVSLSDAAGSVLEGERLKSAWPSWSAHQPFVAAISDVCASVGLTFGCGKGRQVLIP